MSATKHTKFDYCPHCGAVIDTDLFRDAESYQEYRISGICQDCQDAIFDNDNLDIEPYPEDDDEAPF